MNDDHTATVNRSVTGWERQTTAFVESARQWKSVAASITANSRQLLANANIAGLARRLLANAAATPVARTGQR